MLASSKGKQQSRQLQCQGHCIDHIPYYLSGLSAAQFFLKDNKKRSRHKRTPTLKINIKGPV